MSETAEIYQRLIAKCPAAKVPSLQFGTANNYWWDVSVPGFTKQVSDGFAESIIVAHWLTLLPKNSKMAKHLLGKYLIEWGTPHVDFDYTDMYPTPFLALASYLENE